MLHDFDITACCPEQKGFSIPQTAGKGRQDGLCVQYTINNEVSLIRIVGIYIVLNGMLAQ